MSSHCGRYPSCGCGPEVGQCPDGPKEPYKVDMDKVNKYLGENLANSMAKEKIDELKESYLCHKCGAGGYKTDGESKVWCAKCLGIKPEREYGLKRRQKPTNYTPPKKKRK